MEASTYFKFQEWLKTKAGQYRLADDPVQKMEERLLDAYYAGFSAGEQFESARVKERIALLLDMEESEFLNRFNEVTQDDD